jgi:hypothetical protein
MSILAASLSLLDPHTNTHQKKKSKNTKHDTQDQWKLLLLLTVTTVLMTTTAASCAATNRNYGSLRLNFTIGAVSACTAQAAKRWRTTCIIDLTIPLVVTLKRAIKGVACFASISRIAHAMLELRFVTIENAPTVSTTIQSTLIEVITKFSFKAREAGTIGFATSIHIASAVGTELCAVWTLNVSRIAPIGTRTPDARDSGVY